MSKTSKEAQNLKDKDSIERKYRHEGNQETVWSSYYVWECSRSSETRGSHKKGNHCNGYFVRASKFGKEELQRIGKGRLQMNCKCGNRPRKHIGQLAWFETKVEAEMYAKLMNQQRVIK